MSLTVSDSGGGQRPLCPSGTHLARCYRLIDIGTQHEEFKGKPKVLPKVLVYWELPNETAVFKDGEEERPYSISKEYTASLGEKANLRHDLEGWRGRAFTEEELKAFNLKNIVGVPCMITVVHQKSNDGKKTYDKVTSVAALPKDPKTKKPIEIPAQVNPTVIYDIEDGENNVFNDLPDWLKKKIKESEEFNARDKAGAAAEEEIEPEAGDDKIPF